MFCKTNTRAYKSYQRDSIGFGILYTLLVFLSVWCLKHHLPEGRSWTYFWSLLPTVPLVAMVARMAKYLKDETDEFQRLMAMQALLMGTAALLITLLVNDFMRAFAKASPLDPFMAFVIFCAAWGLTQMVQWLRNRVRDDA
jgi:phosphatidylserine synthase